MFRLVLDNALHTQDLSDSARRRLDEARSIGHLFLEDSGNAETRQITCALRSAVTAMLVHEPPSNFRDMEGYYEGLQELQLCIPKDL